MKQAKWGYAINAKITSFSNDFRPNVPELNFDFTAEKHYARRAGAFVRMHTKWDKAFVFMPR